MNPRCARRVLRSGGFLCRGSEAQPSGSYPPSKKEYFLTATTPQALARGVSAQLVQKPRRVSPMARQKKVRSFSSATCAAKKILLRLQVWNLCAVGAQIMRAADCSPFVKKEYFLTATTPQAWPAGLPPRGRGLLHPRRDLPPRAPLRLRHITLLPLTSPKLRQPRRRLPAGLPLYDAASAAVSISSLGRRRAAPSSDHSDSSAFFSAESFLIFGMPQMNAGSTTTISA